MHCQFHIAALRAGARKRGLRRSAASAARCNRQPSRQSHARTASFHVVIGLMKKPDGSLTEASFVPNGEEQGWGGFIPTPGETAEISF